MIIVKLLAQHLRVIRQLRGLDPDYLSVILSMICSITHISKLIVRK